MMSGRVVLIACALLYSHLTFASEPSEAFAALSETLSAQERTAALSEFGDRDRKAFRLTPGQRGGLALKDMDRQTRKATFQFFESFMTARGMKVVLGAIDREARLAAIENRPDYRDPDKFYLAIFGLPESGAWGVRFEGHHLSLNVTFQADAIVAVTPFLLGANPKTLPDGIPDPLMPFLDAHDNPDTFLVEVAKLFRGANIVTRLDGAKLETGGFGAWGHPHMTVTAPNDFGA